MRARHRVGALAAALFVALATGLDRAETPVHACGPWLETEVFAWPNGPEDPGYYSGNIGIFQPTYDRKQLVVAWRTLAGRPLTSAERSAYLPAPESRRPPSPEEMWLVARRSSGVPGAPAGINRDGYLPSTYSYVLNCGDSALLNAAETLEARRNSAAYQPHEFEAWVVAQDEVFGNCSLPIGVTSKIPATLPSTSSALARADRAYQIAAARFYAGDFEAAEAAFKEIATDQASPWRRIAPYLAARAMVRQGTLGGKDSAGDLEALVRAEEALRRLADDGPPELRESAHELVRFVQMRSRPMEALVSAAQELRTPESDAVRFRHRLSEFDKLMGRIPADKEPDDELVEWVEIVRNLREDPVAHALARWGTSHSEAWLVAAFVNATTESAELPGLLESGAKVAPGSPAFPMVTFHRARLMLARGDVDGARTVLDSALSERQLPASTVNQLKAARLLTARNMDEFLVDAVRMPVPGWNDGGWYWRDTGAYRPSPTFDADSLDAINERMSLTVLRRAAANPRMPPDLRRRLLAATLARAILVEQPDVVRVLVPEVSRTSPALAGPLRPLSNAPDGDTVLSEGWLLLLSQPGLRPFLPFGTSREPDHYAELDPLRDNWWCGFKPAKDSVAPYMTPNWARGGTRFSGAQRSLYASPDALPPLGFLTADERQSARDEWQRLVALDTAPTELERRAITWVDAHPDSPRAPHILAQAVRAGHLGCGDETTWPLSKKAFTLLHQRYPKSVWAQKTPYWYK
jgi:hypothetical protein